MVGNKTNRSMHIQLFFAAAMLLLILKAAQLQLFQSDFRKQAEVVAVEKYTEYPSRGLIYDRNNQLLVTNTSMYDLLVTYNQIDPDMDTLKFCRLLDVSREYFETTLQKNWNDPRYSKSVPFLFLSKLAPEEFYKFQESLYEFPGFEIQYRNAREYPISSAAHVLGYIQEATREQINEEPAFYALGDYIGASGIEWAYEKDLRGKKGYRYVLKDNRGNEVASFAGGEEDLAPESGYDLQLAIDSELQQYAEQLLANKRGAVVAIEPSTGEILTLASAPSYDPSSLTIHNNNRGLAYRELVNAETKPLFNRALMAEYPPGSLFKPFIALIAMQEGILDPGRRITCNGGFFFNGQLLTGCHGHPTCYNVSSAIQYSCNNYFVTVFREVIDQYGSVSPTQGLDAFNAYLDRFGMNQKLGIDFPNEKTGFYPSSEYYAQEFENEMAWYSLWIRSLGIGQGELLTTNLQLANMAAILANRGWYYPPHLLKNYRNNVKPIDPKYRTRREVGIDAEYFEPVVNGMEKVVQSGTARLAYIPDIPICGKTGTAENAGKDHSIFFCFAPKENPQIALAVYVENAGFGGSVAAPIASLVIEKYMAGEIRSPQRKWLESRMLEMNLNDLNP